MKFSKKRLRKYLPVILLMTAACGLTAIVIAITIIRTPIRNNWRGLPALGASTPTITLGWWSTSATLDTLPTPIRQAKPVETQTPSSIPK